MNALAREAVLQFHDAEPGPLARCQITGSENLRLVIDLGHQPPCDALVTNLSAPQTTYPLALWQCPESGLAQLDYVVPGEEVYPASYPYRSGISAPVVAHQFAMAADACRRFQGTSPNPLVIDIGSNDGTLLQGFKAKGCRALGVEPTDVAKLARVAGIATIQEFFTEELAQNLVNQYGAPRIVTMTNVFAHMAGLGEVMRGLCALLKGDAVFITESHYLLDILEGNQFDTIYHEHIRTYSLKALVTLFPMYGLEVFDVERATRYGGNIRVFVARKGTRHVEASVGELLLLEEAARLHEPETWLRWRIRVLNNRDRTMEFLYTLKRQGFSIVGCSAPGRAATLLNFYGIDQSMIPYTGELADSLKLDKYLPGCNIPVRRNTRFAEEQPHYIVLFSWHYADVIRARLRAEGVKSKLIQPLPTLQVHHD